MSFENLFTLSQSFLRSTHFDCTEESVPPSKWTSFLNDSLSSLQQIRQLFHNSDSNDLNPPPVQFLMVLGGILGNRMTSMNIRSSALELEELAESVLIDACSYCHVDSARSLLLLPPRKSTRPFCDSLFHQLLQLAVSQLSKTSSNESSDPLNTKPFYRDALVWLVLVLDYPELAGEECISVVQPLGLRLTGDYHPTMQLGGLHLLQQLACKARVADWRQNNRAEAVLSQLFEHRIANRPGSNEDVLSELYATLFALVGLLPPTVAKDWYIRFADRLLFEVTMETRKSKLTILLQNLLKLIRMMNLEFVAHCRGFLRCLPIVLLGPRTPSYLSKSLSDSAQDRTVYLLMLQCLCEFLDLARPIVCPSLLPDLIPPLLAFVDLGWTSDDDAGGGQPASVEVEQDEVFSALKGVITTLLLLEPELLRDVFIPACVSVPRLSQFLQPA